jgi:ribosomal protein S18 acetylase RimI-like enzyme
MSTIEFSVEDSAPAIEPYRSVAKDEFRALMQASNLSEHLQNAEHSSGRFPYLYQPRPFAVTARIAIGGQAGVLVGMASFVELGDYNFLANLAVHRDFHKQGIGRELIRRGIAHSRKHYRSAEDQGYASLVALMTTDTLPTDPVEHPAFHKYGFRKMTTAAAFLRGDQQDGG